ncbi:uncharacterized protein LOC119736282 [Patiria miniata]|uniref:Uncharacterized protein n=1 Tax=Patiria miniata TaxID=46514 RepID=A0A914ASB3_PATMI|nr:uncharacterized protein LOC119736282 [Patiria miniata]
MASSLALMCIVCLTAQQVIADTHSTCSPDPQHTTVSAVLQVSSADVEARQETSFTLRSASAAQPILNTTQSCSGNANHDSDVVEILRSLQQTVEELKTVVAELCTKAPCAADATDSPVEELTTTAPPTTTAPASSDYPVINEDGARWRLFWWWTGTVWPGTDVVTDVLQEEYGDCEASALYCFSRLPQELQESSAEMLGRDSAGNVYRWAFNPDNDVAHAVWQAFHDHQESTVKNGDVWNPTTVAGTAPAQAQDSFHYREEHGVKSLQIDDDNCDCYTSLSLGHGMCLQGHDTAYGPENVFGVDLLYDSYCQAPIPSNSLLLYFREDE